MATQAWFPIPYWIETASKEVYNEIQEELLSCFNRKKFSQIEGWTDDTHELNENPFEGNVLDECPNFLNFLHINIMSYLDELKVMSPREYVITQSWFTKTKHRKFAHLHDHGSSDLSGVYYIQTNGKDGNLIFEDPMRSYATNYIFQSITGVNPELPPKNGLIALWPSMIQHRTQPNPTQDVRISLSFNISFIRKFDDTCIYR